MNRRTFLKAVAATAAVGAAAPTVIHAADAKPVLLGGKPVHTGGWPMWPRWNEAWEQGVLNVYRTCKWNRNSDKHVETFETAFANMLGAKKCVTTTSGTTAMTVALHAMEVGAGDEVITSPFTFIAPYNVILNVSALPVFADTNPETLTMCPKSIEKLITDRTRAILPVHIFGSPCDMDAINAIAKKHKLAVIEDACQACLAEYDGRKAGTLGDLGCFSFQESKHLPAGEGGAVTGMDERLIDKCNSFHNVGRPVGANKGTGAFTRGHNLRMMQVQAVILLQELEARKQDILTRCANADYLSAALNKIPGIATARLQKNSRAVWYLYPFRYDEKQFNGLSREKFAKALSAEGVPCSPSYREQYNEGVIDEAINSRGFKRLWTSAQLKAYRDSFQQLKGTKQACQTVVAIGNKMLLAERSALDHIPEAIRKIQKFSAELAKR
ncbi:MAG: DegT/DnrJ/EryC1/StrS family aminotransferase [Verrucomicrobia bacterium]|nr:DegT/DnrJ/EryC1/StrS family aminotransferase [Verrucomicrobiota bacterium]